MEFILLHLCVVVSSSHQKLEVSGSNLKLRTNSELGTSIDDADVETTVVDGIIPHKFPLFKRGRNLVAELIPPHFWVRPFCVVVSPKVQFREPSWHSSVSRAYAWFHTASSGMIGPGFEPHQFLIAGMGKRLVSCHAGHQMNSRCHTTGKS